MYYVSVKDFINSDLTGTNISEAELLEISEAIAEEGVEGVANYLNEDNMPLRDYILKACGMDTSKRIATERCMHRTLNGEGTEIYNGTRWVGRSLGGSSIHEIHQDIATDEKYVGMGDELGQRIRPTNKQFLKNNPTEKLAVKKSPK